jgi:hypothetical protein
VGTPGEDFDAVLHEFVHESIDKNEQFRKRFGKYKRWDWDDEAVTLTFSDPDKPPLVIHVTVVGTTRGEEWQWTWANRNFEDRSRLGMDKVREFGETHGFEKLTTAFFDADEHTGWEMTSVAVHILKAFGSYRFPTDEGYCYLVFRNLENTTVN